MSETKTWIHQYETDGTSKWICPDCGEFTDSCCCDDEESFVCDDCGLKFNYEDISINEVSVCKFCDDEELEEKESNLMDKYREVGMSPSDFM
jgi:predicted RNA-binding Zn-ribbon protein involved in translation (DUF1610 family)